MDASAFWHDIKFSLRHLKDFSRVAIVIRQSAGAGQGCSTSSEAP
jgi:hypothetical protein